MHAAKLKNQLIWWPGWRARLTANAIGEVFLHVSCVRRRFCSFARRHVSDILADEMTGGKVLVFAHHRNVLDALEQAVVRTGRVEYIRIDGRTKVRIPMLLCELRFMAFQPSSCACHMADWSKYC